MWQLRARRVRQGFLPGIALLRTPEPGVEWSVVAKDFRQARHAAPLRELTRTASSARWPTLRETVCHT